LRAEPISKDEVLATYRLRWQVENYFKRLKSILGFGELPKKKESEAEYLAGDQDG
jgi:IS4 transposase